MMSLPRFSIRAMIFAVFLVAADLAALGLIGPYALDGLRFGLLSILPMSNILAVASYRASTRRTPGRAFLIGFVLAGALAVLIWFHLFLMADERRLVAMLNWYAETLVDNVRYYITTNKIFYVIVCLIISLILFVSLSVLPQMVVALSGGWIARRYAARSRSSVASLPPTMAKN
jgi:hypothetical protein